MSATEKETLAQVFSCEFCEISNNTFFYRTPLVAASATSYLSQWDQFIYPPIGHICKICLEIVKSYKQMSLGIVNICHTIIISCDHPRIKQPHKTKKTWPKKDMFHRCS